jgi:hypothetical protein
MAEQSTDECVCWRRLTAGLICAVGLALGGWTLSLVFGGEKLSAVTPGLLGLAAGVLFLLGVLLWMRVMDAALVGVVLLDVGGLAAVLVPLGLGRVNLSVVVPLGMGLAVLVGVALTARRRWRGRPWFGVAVQLVYLVTLTIYALRVGRGHLGPLAWAWLYSTVLLAAACHLAYVTGSETRPWERLTGLPRWARALVVFAVALAAFVAAAGPRLARPSRNNHFVYAADSFLHGRLALSPAQLRRKNRLRQHDDWSRVDKVRLARDVRTHRGAIKKGTVLRGAWIKKQRRRSELFRTTRGQVVRLERGAWRSAGQDWYVSFPPMPAVLMAPGVAIWGYRFNDVWFSVLLAALSPLLLFLLLGRLRDLGLSERDQGDDLWLTLLFALGTVNYFVSVRGEVWYTAHVVGVCALLLYLHASLEARRPLLAGLALGCGVASRVTLAFAVVLFVAELLRVKGGWPAHGTGPGTKTWIERLRAVRWRPLVKPALLFASPLVVIAAVLLLHNHARFDSPLEFGHTYLDIYWQDRIQQYGLFDVHYLARNLSAALTLTPHFQPEPPYVLVSRHGMSLLLVTPALLLVVWPKNVGPLHRPLWLAVALMAALVLLYQNTGFVQYSYRFAVDFLPLLVLLMALGGRRLSTPVKVLIVIGVLMNLFGAATFGLSPEFYGRTNWVWTPLDPGCAC